MPPQSPGVGVAFFAESVSMPIPPLLNDVSTTEPPAAGVPKSCSAPPESLTPTAVGTGEPTVMFALRSLMTAPASIITVTPAGTWNVNPSGSGCPSVSKPMS